MISKRTCSKSPIIYSIQKQKYNNTHSLTIIPGLNYAPDIEIIPENQMIADNFLKSFSMKQSKCSQSQGSKRFKTQNDSQFQDNFHKNRISTKAMNKQIPMNIFDDKETLYSEMIKLKQKNNILQEENKKLEQNLRLNKKNNGSLQILMQNVEGVLDSNYCIKKKDSKIFQDVVIKNYKFQINQLKQQIQSLQKQIQDHEKTKLYTQLQEVQIQLYASLNEEIRLKSLFGQSKIKSSNPQKISEQQKDNSNDKLQFELVQLQQDNSYLKGVVILNEEQIFEYQSTIDFILCDLSTLKKNIYEIQKELDQKKAQINIQNEILKQNSYQIKSQQNKESDELIDKVKEKKRQQALQQEYQQAIENIIYIDKLNKNLQQQLIVKSDLYTKEKSLYEEEFVKIQQMFQELGEKYTNLSVLNAQYRAILNGENNEEFIANLFHKRLRVVQKEEIQPLIQTIKMRLQFKRYTFIDFFKVVDIINQVSIYFRLKTNKLVSYLQVIYRKDLFDSEPFLMETADQALLVARYLVEDGSETYIRFEPTESISIQVVETIIKTLMGPYKIFCIEEEIEIQKKIQQILTNKNSSLNQHFDMLPSEKQGLLTKQQILDTFKYMDIELSNEQIEYIFIQLQGLSNHTNYFSYRKLIEIFTTPQVDQGRNVYQASFKKKLKVSKPTLVNLWLDNILKIKDEK